MRIRFHQSLNCGKSEGKQYKYMKYFLLSRIALFFQEQTVPFMKNNLFFQEQTLFPSVRNPLFHQEQTFPSVKNTLFFTERIIHFVSRPVFLTGQIDQIRLFRKPGKLVA